MVPHTFYGALMLTQDNKPFSIQTPLGENVLLLAEFNGKEGISELFQFDLELLSEYQSVAMEDIIGQKVTISVFLPWTEEIRYVNGLIASFSQEFRQNEPGQEGQPLFRYSAIMVPSLWLLTQTSDSRIFQKMSVPDIVEKVFADNGFTDFENKLSAEYEPREYTVQYNETDFNFISRLMEQEGIYYFFIHEQGRHILIMADHPSASTSCPQQESARFLKSGNEDFGDKDLIDRLKKISQIRAGKYTLRDYNYEVPDTDLEVTCDTTTPLGPGERERYDYPGRYAKREAGDKLSSIKMEEEEARIAVWSGAGNCRAFSSGFKFKLEESYQEDWNDKEYLLTRINHRMNQVSTYLSGPAENAEQVRIYENQFECIPHEVPFRPLRKTPVPVIDGVQTAVVVGPQGEEIYTDELGRVKVQFHWDREGKYDENTTCWLRVAQSMAGLGWGAVFLPRIGHEVLVEFLEGNPDHPIVTGQVYNGVNTIPYKLPDEKTKTTFKSSSSPGGEGFNEIRFDDKAGEEQIFIHAERNQDIRVKSNSYEWVGRDRHLIVKLDQFVHVENNFHKKVDAHHKEWIGGDRHLEVGGKEAKKVGSSLSLNVGSDGVYEFGGGHKVDVTTGYSLKAMSVKIEADTGIELTCGGSSIILTPSAIFIAGGPLVNINSGSGPPASPVTAGTVPPASPEDALEADVADPGSVAKIKEQQVKDKTGKYGKEKSQPHKPPKSQEEKEEKKWVEIKLKDQEGNPVPGEPYEIKLPDGTVAEGTLDGEGFARVDGVDPGNCEVKFPNLDRDCWEPKS